MLNALRQRDIEQMPSPWPCHQRLRFTVSYHGTRAVCISHRVSEDWESRVNAWQTLLFEVGGNATLLAVLGWLGKSLLEKIILRDTRQFEMDLKVKTDAAIERLKAELQLRSIEHQVRFSQLHEKRATVIAQLYGYIIDALWAAESFLTPMEWLGEPSKEEKHWAAIQKLIKLYRYFSRHRIYLPREMCVSLDALVDIVREHVVRFGVYVRHVKNGDSSRLVQEKNDAWEKGWQAIREQIPLAREQLEKELRDLLGHTEIGVQRQVA